MCYRVDCEKCGKPTYKGCGRHIEDVLEDVLPEDRCACRDSKSSTGGTCQK